MLAAYIISVILTGVALVSLYISRREMPLSGFELFLAVVTPFLPGINIMVLIGVIDEYMRRK